MKKEQIKKIIFKIIFITIGIILGIVSTFIYIQKYGIPFENIAKNISKIDEEKALQDTLTKVGKLIVLPTDETPVMATIIDVEKLIKDEPFYSNAKNGDIVLMYQKALKAIIYSPEKDIIVNVGPVYVPPVETVEENSSIIEDDTSSTSE